MLNKVWGYDTETVLKNGGGYPYTFQLTNGDIKLFHVQPNLNPVLFRSAWLSTINRYCEHGDALISYNLFFENQVIFRDMIFLFKENRIDLKIGDCRIKGVLEEPTPFLELHFPKKTVWVIDAAKYFQGDTGGTLAEVAGQFLGQQKMERPYYLGQRKPRPHEFKRFKQYSMIDAILAEGLGGEMKLYHKAGKQDEWCISAAHLAGKYFNQEFTEGKKLDLASPSIEGGALWARFGGYRRGWQGAGVYRDFVHLDLRSAYPWAYRNMRAYFGGGYFECRKVPNDGEGIFKIETVLPGNEIRPLFQKRGKHGAIETQDINKNIKFWTTGHEILAYKKVWPSWKFKILLGYEWKGQSKNKPLQKWADHFFQIKDSVKKDDKKMGWKRNFAKAMLNHITGKFDSSITHNEEIWMTPQGEISFQRVVPGSLRNLFVAALIRGKVRARVWFDSRYGQQFPVRPSIQEMTDSMDIPQSELHRIKLSNKLGGWEIDSKDGVKCEGDLIFLRTGSYMYYNYHRKKASKVAYHGIQIRDKRTNKFSVKQFFNFLKKGGGTYTRRRMVRAREALKKDPIGSTALLFHDKVFNFKVSKIFKGEFLSWLKERRVKLRNLR